MKSAVRGMNLRIETAGPVSTFDRAGRALETLERVDVIRRSGRALDYRVSEVLASADRYGGITPTELAKAVGLSPSRLSHIFRRETGYALSRYLRARRLLMAVELLTQTNESIKAIAFETGYRHESSFVRAFTRCLSEAPGTFRRRAREGECSQLIDVSRYRHSGTGS